VALLCHPWLKNTVLRFIRSFFRNQELVFLALLCAVAVQQFPLQRHIEISRLQHYSLAAYVVALGFMLQMVWSWRHLTTWGRVTLGCSSAYLGTFAMYFYSSPWLDSRVSLQTEGQSTELQMYLIIFGVVGAFVGILWIIWNIDERRRSRGVRKNDE
jgi:glucan phosphoethanolaminetransferase (alkaline phosphatase superfamily)